MIPDPPLNGSQLPDSGNGPGADVPPPLNLKPLPDHDWFFRTLREVIEANRQRDNDAVG